MCIIAQNLDRRIRRENSCGLDGTVSLEDSVSHAFSLSLGGLYCMCVEEII